MSRQAQSFTKRYYLRAARFSITEIFLRNWPIPILSLYNQNLGSN
jgi:hypothetical protein